MKFQLWDVVIAGTLTFFLLLFSHSRKYFIHHHLISVSFATLVVLGAFRAYSTYRKGMISKAQLYVTFVLLALYLILGLWVDSVSNGMSLSI